MNSKDIKKWISALGGTLYRSMKEYDRYEFGDEYRLDYVNKYIVSLLDIFVPIIRAYFRYEAIGLENIPLKGRAIIVSNHGILPVDGLLLLYAIKEARDRWPRGLTDRRIFKIPILRQFFLDLGIVIAHPLTGRMLLEREEIVYLMPGGAREAFKSSRQRYKLMWQGRKGFVKLAIQTQAPIIPAVCIGIDEIYHIPFDGYGLSEKIFGKNFFFPLTIPIGLGPIPLPVKLTHYIGNPVRFRYRSEDSRDPKKVARLHRRVRKSMERLMNQGLHERRLQNSPRHQLIM